MGCTPSAMQPHELLEFRKLNTSIENVEIPARPENRAITDKKGFILFGIFLLILLPFLIYTLTKSDPRYFTYPTDDCGNFCGLDNTFIESISCSGADHSTKPYIDGYDSNDFRCVSSCDDSKVTIGRMCLPRRAAEKLSGQVDPEVVLAESRADWWKFLLTMIITIVLSLLALVALRYAPAPVVWTIIILAALLLIAASGGLWYIYSQISAYARPEDNSPTVVAMIATIWTITSVIILIVFTVLFKKIALVIQLYKESTKVLAAMPQLLLVPIATSLIQFFILGLFFSTSFHLMASFDVYTVSSSFDVYKVSSYVPKIIRYYSLATIFTIFLNFVVTIWVMRIIAGVQYMIISSSASIWYFAKNKQFLDPPVFTSIKITMRYHLGTISFGSFLMMLFSVVQGLLRLFCRNLCCRCLIVTCCPVVEVILKFISENSYIETGIHGQSFCKSAKRATKLLMANARSVIAVSCVGDFVITIMVMVLTIIATAISFALFMGPPFEVTAFPVLLCLILNLIIVCITFATFQTIIDTLFICFCEDCVLNDGVSRPFYMSRGLMEFVENSKKMFGEYGKIN